MGDLQSWRQREESDEEMEAMQFDWNVDNIHQLPTQYSPAEAEQ